MNKHRIKNLTAVLLTICILLGCVYSAQAVIDPAPKAYTVIWNAVDADGNALPEYVVDANGNVVDRAKAEDRVQACADNLPSKYDVRSERCVTPIRDQGGANCCWAFSSTGAMELSYVRQGFGSVSSTDFSEAHLTWFGQRQRTTNTNDPTYGDGIMLSNPFSYGGNWQIMASSLMRGSGMQLESKAPWVVSHNQTEILNRMTQPESDRYVSYCHLWSAEGIMDLSRTRAKQLIMENGSIIMSYFHEYGTSDTYFNRSKFAYYRGVQTSGTNHSVTVVGWDDSFSRSNFNAVARPSSNGAWLVKGSWNSSYGDAGYYWVSYEEPSIKSMASFRAAKTDLYDNIYQYDGSYPSVVFGTDNSIRTGSGMANRFTAGKDEILTHVVFYSLNSDRVDVTAQVFVPGDTTYSANKNDPRNGMQEVEAAKTTMENVGYGYFTMPLKQQVPLRAGDTFVVLITFHSRGGEYVQVPAEGETADYPTEGTLTYSGNPGESFLYLNDTWYDSNSFTVRKIDYNNVPIKALTKNADAADLASLEICSMPDRTQYRIGESLDTTGLSLLHVNAYGDRTVVTSGYTVSSQKFTKPGAVTLTVTYKGLSCDLTVQVERTPGDTDGNGEVDLRDVTLMRRILAGWSDITYYEANLDVNGDGKLTLVDVALVTRYITGGYGVVLQ